MAYLKNTTDTDLEFPSLGVVIPAGAAVEVDVDPADFTGHPLLHVTKTKPAKTDVITTTEQGE